LIPREYYYSYGNTAVSGVPSSEKNKGRGNRRRLIGSRNNSRVNETSGGEVGNPNIWGRDEPQLTTSDGFSSSGAPSSGSRPRIRSKWAKGGRSIILAEREEERLRKVVEDDIAQHCKSLRTNPGTWLVDYSES
jgi:hypothetical protein